MKRFTISRRFLTLVGTFTLSLLLYVDRACISTAKEPISKDLGFDITKFGWIMAMFTLGYALLQTPTGWLSDKKGPRSIIAAIVAIWSILTAITGAAWNFTSMLIIRFLFGAGEAGAFPSMAKVTFNWFPTNERGLVQGINFSGSRIGAAFAMLLVSWMISEIGWRYSFFVLGLVGVVFAILWYTFFRNTPEESKKIYDKELAYIINNRQKPSSAIAKTLPFIKIIKSKNVVFAMVQYVASNFTFYFALAWMHPYLKEKFALGGIHAGLLSMGPLIAGAFGNWVSGAMVDYLYKKGKWGLSRRLPAIVGFSLAATGMLLLAWIDANPLITVLFLSIAIFGADMSLSPSWAFCIDIGKEHSGSVSGTMNMAGNLGAFVTIIAFPYLLKWTGVHEPFFYVCSTMSVLAIFMWVLMDPEKPVLGA